MKGRLAKEVGLAGEQDDEIDEEDEDRRTTNKGASGRTREKKRNPFIKYECEVKKTALEHEEDENDN